jgi:CubicO group peptidase (beta-lactamase class C family)
MRKISARLLYAVISITSILITQTSLANVTLQIVRGSGEFQTLETKIIVVKPEAITFQWWTDQPNVAGATWQVTRINGVRNQVVASGKIPAPAAGHVAWFTIPAGTFLQSSPVTRSVTFKITVVPHSRVLQKLGNLSLPVTVIQRSQGESNPPTFASANFPAVEIASYEEKIGIVPFTQVHYAGADVTVRVINKTQTVSDPIWLFVKDGNLVMRQSTENQMVSSLNPGASKLVTIHMDAVLPPPASQMPQAVQYAEWKLKYASQCGVDLRAVMDWRGPLPDAPVNSHSETILATSEWADYTKVAPGAMICNGPQCISVCNMTKNIRTQLDGKVVGYSFFVGQYPKFESNGFARSSAELKAQQFTSRTKITVASVSKMVTAIAAVRILRLNGVSLDAAIGPFLPGNWTVSNFVRNITFSQLLSHTSGIKDYGNTSNDYADLQRIFTQPVNSNTATMCQPPEINVPLGSGINPNNNTPCYSNYNFAIFRLLLPRVAGFAEDPNENTRPQTLAAQYVRLVQQNVFEPVGQQDVECRPPTQGAGASDYSFAYLYPGSKMGHDWKDNTLNAGGAGWYLSVEDITKVLLSLNAKDGKILSATAANDELEIMRTRRLGWDVFDDKELQKNGGWSANCDENRQNCQSISTSIAVFGPVTGPRVVAVLFMNSNISGGISNGKGAREVLETAYYGSLSK